MCALTASAQKDVVSVGGHLMYGAEIEKFGLGIKGQYNFTDPIRAEVAFDYYMKNHGLKMWDLSANVHYLFPLDVEWSLYPLAGLVYKHVSHDGSDNNDGNFGVNIGGGAQYRLTADWTLGAELKYQMIDDFDQFVLSFGITYNF